MFALYSPILFTHLVSSINYLLFRAELMYLLEATKGFILNMISIILDRSSKFIVILHSLKHTHMPDSLINCRTGSRHGTRRTRAGDQGLSRTPLHSLSIFHLILLTHPSSVPGFVSKRQHA